MIPDWLRRHLTALGRWDTDGVHRRLSARVCRCGTRILAGLDDDTCALPARVDPGPVDSTGELQALVQGRATYAIRYCNGYWEIDRRTQIDIRYASPDVVPVLVSHQCGRAIAANGVEIVNPRPRRTLEVPEQCPF